MPAISEQAIAAIGKDDPGTDWQLRPEAHARSMPTQAGALKRVLEGPELQQIIQQFRVTDTAAIAAQARYKRIGRISLYAGTIATVVGALFLLPLGDWLKGSLALAGSALQIGSMLVAFLASRILLVTKPFDAWMKQRAEAEIARIELFDRITRTELAHKGDELPLLPLKLEYFRRYQLDVQQRYYRGRGTEHAGAMRRNNAWLKLSFALTIISVLLGLLLGARLAADWLPVLRAWVPDWSNELARLELNRVLLTLGVLASAFYGLGVARSLMDLDERNASRFLTNAENLDYLSRTSLPQARQAAEDGRSDDVYEFIQRVQGLVSSEHKEWIVLGTRDRADTRRSRYAGAVA